MARLIALLSVVFLLATTVFAKPKLLSQPSESVEYSISIDDSFDALDVALLLVSWQKSIRIACHWPTSFAGISKWIKQTELYLLHRQLRH